MTNCTSMFEGCTSLVSIDLEEYADCVTASSMFKNCTSLETVDNMDAMSNVVYADSMFYGCALLEEAVISGKAIDISDMFHGCASLTEIDGVPATATDLENTFSGCSSLEYIHNWEVDVTNATMTGCFTNCSSLVKIYVKKPVVGETDWHLVKVETTPTTADLTVYDTTLNNDNLVTTRTKSVIYKSDKKLQSFKYTEEFLGTHQSSSVPDSNLKKLLKYKYPYGDEGLDPSRKNFVFWASEGSSVKTNLNFGEVTQNIIDVLRVCKADSQTGEPLPATAVLVANAKDTTDSSTQVPGRTVKVNGDLVVTGDITGDVNGDVTGNVTGNADTATKLATARSINGTSFDGSADITTSKWGTARNIYISDSDGTNTGSAVSVNGSGNATLKLPSTIKANLSGNATSATKATQDEDGNNIKDKYGSTLSLSGTSLKLLDANGNANSSLTLGRSNVGLGNVDNTADLAKTVLKAASLGVYTCTTAAATTTKEITVTNFALYTGARLYIIFSNANTAASPKLKVGSTTEKPIKLGSNSAPSTTTTPSNPTWENPADGPTASDKWNGIKANTLYEAYYDGTNWILSAMNGPSMGVKGYYFSTNKSYIKFTNGLIIQWLHGYNQGTITFPISFQNTNYCIIGGPMRIDGIAQRNITARNTGSFTVQSLARTWDFDDILVIGY